MTGEADRARHAPDQAFAPTEPDRGDVPFTLPDLPCCGDLFHALNHLGDVAVKLDNRAYHAIDAHRVLQDKQQTHLRRHDRHDQRRDLYDFILAELRERVAAAGPILRKIATLLAFAKELDRELDDVAAAFEVSPALAREVLHQLDANPNHPHYWQREADLHRRSHGRLHALRAAIAHVRHRTVRASSVVENLNSRLRPYFFLRRQLGPQYLDVLRFFLNHRRFVRSDRPERTGEPQLLPEMSRV